MARPDRSIYQLLHFRGLGSEGSFQSFIATPSYLPIFRHQVPSDVERESSAATPGVPKSQFLQRLRRDVGKFSLCLVTTTMEQLQIYINYSIFVVSEARDRFNL
jgi:hypothetical protein